MTAMEMARLIEWLRAMGLSDSDACSCITFMATGTGLPEKPDEKRKENPEKKAEEKPEE